MGNQMSTMIEIFYSNYYLYPSFCLNSWGVAKTAWNGSIKNGTGSGIDGIGNQPTVYNVHTRSEKWFRCFEKKGGKNVYMSIILIHYLVRRAQKYILK